MDGGVRCIAFSSLFVSRYNIVTIFNLIVITIFILTASKHTTAYPNPPYVKTNITLSLIESQITSLNEMIENYENFNSIYDLIQDSSQIITRVQN